MFRMSGQTGAPQARECRTAARHYLAFGGLFIAKSSLDAARHSLPWLRGLLYAAERNIKLTTLLTQSYIPVMPENLCEGPHIFIKQGQIGLKSDAVQRKRYY